MNPLLITVSPTHAQTHRHTQTHTPCGRCLLKNSLKIVSFVLQLSVLQQTVKDMWILS